MKAFLAREFIPWITCLVFGHQYTCKESENIKPIEDEKENGFESWLKYSQMYCKTCGHVYKSGDTR